MSQARENISQLLNTNRWFLISMVAFFAIIIVVTWRMVAVGQQRIIEYQAIELAEIIARQAASARSTFAKHVVEKLTADGFGSDPDFTERSGFVPIPAQFLKFFGQQASADSGGLFSYKPLSKWNLEPTQGLSDEFKVWAWQQLEAQDQAKPTGPIDWQPVWRFEEIEGVKTLRYMRADPASAASCVACHNTYEHRPEIAARRTSAGLSTQKEWQQHQLLGAIEVNIPLQKVELIAADQTQLTSGVIIGLVALALLSVGALAVRDLLRTRGITRELSWQANHDSLTGLASRAAFERRAQELLTRSRTDGSSHALLFMDLDQFKIVNDTCGHIAGDELLRELAKVMTQHIRRSDLLARLGGDEFGVLLEGCAIGKACETAEKLRGDVRNLRFSKGNRVFEIGVSIGLVTIDAQSPDIATILSQADLACYAAKDEGRNRIQVYSERDTGMHLRQSEMDWASRFNRAIEEDRLRLAVQRAVRLQAGREIETYSEILLRMVDEQGKPIPTVAFISAAERYHFMPIIDRWVVKTVFAMITNRDLPLHRDEVIAINLSGLSINDSDFLGYVQEQFRQYPQVPKQQICFEITETAAVGNIANAQHFINTLRNLGCRFALDDFGAGLSSLAYLKNLAIDFLKIEGSFVKDMLDDPLDRVIVEAVGIIGQRTDMATIAEWVENDSILKVVQSLGIDYAQGFGVHKPELIEVARPQSEDSSALAIKQPPLGFSTS